MIPGIQTIDAVADDVFQERLQMSPEHGEIDPESLHYTIVNAKGLGREQCDWYHAQSHGNPQDDAGALFSL